jgi:hypothetical protein
MPKTEDLAGQIWVPERVLDAYGQAVDAGETAGVQGSELAVALTEGPGAARPPGLYAGAERRVALNVIGAETVLAAAAWPATVPVEGLDATPEQDLKGGLLALALVLLAVDIIAALWISGRLRAAGSAAVMLIALGLVVPEAHAQDDFALTATTGVVLAHVLTGDPQVDEIAQAGLAGLGDRLRERTAVEPDPPMGVDIETDELAFFPFLYWPITATQGQPSDAAYAKLNRYLQTGGMVLFDTRDGDMAGLGGATPESETLQRIASGLDIPPLEPIPNDHVLTRSFYLLQDFPGRYTDSSIWVEAAPADAELSEGMPFRNLNDGVTPVIIGGNDWAAAWAVDESGLAMFPVGRGYAGERQREIANRFGINIVMHVLTGNYKSDQVHVPALLERLGE